jgi:hypothetical protein
MLLNPWKLSRPTGKYNTTYSKICLNTKTKLNPNEILTAESLSLGTKISFEVPLFSPTLASPPLLKK